MRPHDTQTSSLYQQLGGEAGVQTFVGALYFNLLNDEHLSRFFADVDVARVMHHQEVLLAELLGGEDTSSGLVLAEAHHLLILSQGLREWHFDVLLRIVERTLKDLNVSSGLTAAVVARLSAKRRAVLPLK